MFRKRVYVFWIDVSGAQDFEAQEKIIIDFKNNFEKNIKNIWWDNLWNKYIYIGTYPGDVMRIEIN